MVIFHSYVSLPEGMSSPFCHGHFLWRKKKIRQTLEVISSWLVWYYFPVYRRLLAITPHNFVYESLAEEGPKDSPLLLDVPLGKNHSESL